MKVKTLKVKEKKNKYKNSEDGIFVCCLYDRFRFLAEVFQLFTPSHSFPIFSRTYSYFHYHSFTFYQNLSPLSSPFRSFRCFSKISPYKLKRFTHFFRLSWQVGVKLLGAWHSKHYLHNWRDNFAFVKQLFSFCVWSEIGVLDGGLVH